MVLPVNEALWLDVRYGVSGHTVGHVLLAADNDPQLVGGILHQTHHLHQILSLEDKYTKYIGNIW